MRSLRSVLTLILLVGLLAAGCDRGAVEGTTVPSTLPAGSTAAASTTAAAATTTVPASALEGIVIYVADGCADCPLLESTLRGLAGEVPVWVRPAEGTVNRVPTVAIQFDGRVSARWEGQGAVNSAGVIAAFAGARWPTGTIPTTTTTTTIPPTILAAPVAVEDATPCFWCPLVAVSTPEVWASLASADGEWWGSPEPDLIGHLKDGVWAIYRFESPARPGFRVSGLAVAPDGTVWAATTRGVFSLEGRVGTRRFQGANGIAVAPDGTVWAGGTTEGGAVWLARWDGESWVRVDPTTHPGLWSSEGGYRSGPMAVSSDGEVWVSSSYERVLMRYDGATLEPVRVGDRPPERLPVFAIEAAPNGDLWIAGQIETDDDTNQWWLARFDGETWTLHDGWAWDIAVGPDGVVWFATDGGLVSFDGVEWTTHIQGQGIWAVDVAPDGTVWYTDEDGVHILGTP